jgi:hypothetical protein
MKLLFEAAMKLVRKARKKLYLILLNQDYQIVSRDVLEVNGSHRGQKDSRSHLRKVMVATYVIDAKISPIFLLNS